MRMNVAAALARPEILALEPYAHAAWDPDLERLHANENPWRCTGDNSLAGLNRYPEPYPRTLEARLAALYAVAPTQLIAARGSDEGIDLLVRAFCSAGREAVLICPPTFGMYQVAARVQGAQVIEVPLVRAAGFALDEAGLERALAAPIKLAFLCSPGNPTGTTLERAAVLRLARALEGRALVVVDEAYGEFAAGPGCIEALAHQPNLVVLRSLSKAWALAGARCGVVIADPSITALLRRITPPYAMPAPSVEAVLAALAPAPLARARARIAAIVAERTRLARALATLPAIAYFHAREANFLLVACHDAGRVLAAAARAGFLLRDLSGSALTAACVRITVGTPEQDDRLLAGLARA
jgi:histidinol-phosphate aminotransferase